VRAALSVDDSHGAYLEVFYLLHGAGDNEGGWTRRGAADLILDNLFADNKLVPMIVVMPNGSAQGPRPGTVLAGTIMQRADADKNASYRRKSSSPPPLPSTRSSTPARWTRNSSPPASIV
jgi:enterochelin esterase-like enzyme